eukprot:m.1625483 g.1625483  ORF g.1625483 m.1625483 type:complete len:124 (+) comp25393_c1_seq2:10429-10800(+)
MRATVHTASQITNLSTGTQIDPGQAQQSTSRVPAQLDSATQLPTTTPAQHGDEPRTRRLDKCARYLCNLPVVLFSPMTACLQAVVHSHQFVLSNKHCHRPELIDAFHRRFQRVKELLANLDWC